MTLWLAIGVISGLTAMALLALLARRRGAEVGRNQFDLNVYRDQLRELERDVEQTLLAPGEAVAARVEIERRMLALSPDGAPADTGQSKTSDRVTAAAVAAAVPLAALALYLYIGQPNSPDQPFTERRQAIEKEQAQAVEMRGAIELLAKRMAENPSDTQGWLLLARSYLAVEQTDKAVDAYAQAFRRSNHDLAIGVDYAEAMVIAAGSDRPMPGAARDLFKEVRQAQPLDPKARFYLAVAKARDGDARGALQDWVDLLALSPPDAPWRAIVSGRINEAARQLGIAPASVVPTDEAKQLAASLRQSKPAAAGQAARDKPAPGPSADDVDAAQKMSDGDRQQMVRSMVQRLADRLKDEPGDLAGWQRLLRAYQVLGETAKAAEAQKRIEALQGK